MRLCGLYHLGIRNALDIKLTRLNLAFDDLPDAFDGFRILQLSDLHVDFLSGTLDAALDRVSGEQVDLCVLSRFYRSGSAPSSGCFHC